MHISYKILIGVMAFLLFMTIISYDAGALTMKNVTFAINHNSSDFIGVSGGLTMIKDYSGSMRNCSLGAGYTNKTGLIGQAVDYEAASYCSVGAYMDYSGGDRRELTVAIWVKNNTAAENTLIALGSAQAGQGGQAWKITWDTDNLLYYMCAVSDCATKKYYTLPNNQFDIRQDKWRLVGFSWSSGVLSLWVNGTNVTSSATKVTDSAMTQYLTPNLYLIVGANRNNPAPYQQFGGQIDGVYLFNKQLNQSEWDDLYNAGAGAEANFTEGPPPPPAAIHNTTGFLTNKYGQKITDIFEGRKFYLMANYTVDNIEASTGACNFTAENISANFFKYNNSNETLLTANSRITLELTEGNTNLIDDIYSFYACRGTVANSLSIYFNSTLYKTIPSTALPVCGSGYHSEFQNITVNSQASYINFTLLCPDCTASASSYIKILSNKNETIAYRRNFLTHTEGMDYNSTLKLYTYQDYFYSFETPGTFDITYNCNATTDTLSQAVTNRNLTINFLSVGNKTFANGTVVEITGQDFTALIDVSGDTYSLLRFNASYKNGTLIRSVSDENMTLNDELIGAADFIYLDVYARDSEGNPSHKAGYFTYNDTILPLISFNEPRGTNSSVYYLNQNVIHDVDMVDYNLFAYECTIKDEDGNIWRKWNDTALTPPAYTFKGVFLTNLSGNFTENCTVWDDHTEKDWKKPKYEKSDNNLLMSFEYKDKELKKKNVSVEYQGLYSVEDLVLKEKKDRIIWNYTFDLHSDIYNKFVWHSWKFRCDVLFYRDYSDYPHFVCWEGENWLDIYSEQMLDYDVYSCGEGCYDVNAKFLPEENVIISSIGGINRFEKIIEFQVLNETYDVITPFLTVRECPTDTLQDTIMFFLIFVVIAALLVLSYTIIKIPVVTLGAWLGLIFYGFSFVGCSVEVGIVLILVSVVGVISTIAYYTHQ